MMEKNMKSIECKHYEGTGFGLKLNKDEMLNVCDECALNLYKGIFEQIIAESEVHIEMNKQLDKKE